MFPLRLESAFSAFYHENTKARVPSEFFLQVSIIVIFLDNEARDSGPNAAKYYFLEANWTGLLSLSVQ